MARKLRIYSTLICPYCIRAKALFEARGLAYEEIDVTGDRAARAWLVETTGRRTVPQIFIDDEPIGGYDDFVALDRSGALKKKLGLDGAQALHSSTRL